MIWLVRFQMGRRSVAVIPSVADSPMEAILKAVRLLPFSGYVLDMTVMQLDTYRHEAAEVANEQLETAYGDFCDYADNDSRVTDAQFQAGIAHYHETSGVLWEVCNG